MSSTLPDWPKLQDYPERPGWDRTFDVETVYTGLASNDALTYQLARLVLGMKAMWERALADLEAAYDD